MDSDNNSKKDIYPQIKIYRTMRDKIDDNAERITRLEVSVEEILPRLEGSIDDIKNDVSKFRSDVLDRLDSQDQKTDNAVQSQRIDTVEDDVDEMKSDVKEIKEKQDKNKIIYKIVWTIIIAGAIYALTGVPIEAILG